MDALVTQEPRVEEEWLSVLRAERAAMAVADFRRRWGQWFDGMSDQCLMQLSAEMREYVAMRRYAEGRR